MSSVFHFDFSSLLERKILFDRFKRIRHVVKSAGSLTPLLILIGLLSPSLVGLLVLVRALSAVVPAFLALSLSGAQEFDSVRHHIRRIDGFAVLVLLASGLEPAAEPSRKSGVRGRDRRP